MMRFISCVFCLFSLLFRVECQTFLPADTVLYMSWIDSSFLFANQGKIELAESYLEKAIGLAPKHPTSVYLLNNLAGLQQMQGKLEKAIETYNLALVAMPEEQTIRFNRARLFALSGKHQAAITDYAILVAQAPKNELYLYQRAMSYMLMKKYDLSEEDLKRIIELNAQSLKARLGYALLETARGRYDEAERLFDYLVSRLSKNPEVYEGRARLYHARKMKGYAMRDLERAFELSKKNISPTLYRLRASIHRSLGDEVAAKKDDTLAEQAERMYFFKEH